MHLPDAIVTHTTHLKQNPCHAFNRLVSFMSHVQFGEETALLSINALQTWRLKQHMCHTLKRLVDSCKLCSLSICVNPARYMQKHSSVQTNCLQQCLHTIVKSYLSIAGKDEDAETTC